MSGSHMLISGFFNSKCDYMGQLCLLQVVSKCGPQSDFMKPVTILMSNPLDAPRVEARATDTLPARNVFHQTQAAVRGLTNHIQTQGEMDES